MPSPQGLLNAPSLYHRVPDGQRQWISADGKVVLGHARLSIIDLTTGDDQPIASEDERTRVVVNGEFYGFEAIRRELEGRGHHLRTKSDSEIALHLYVNASTFSLTATVSVAVALFVVVAGAAGMGLLVFSSAR
jgi:asparagine synthetase B (glutamine-hydrolysing)